LHIHALQNKLHSLFIQIGAFLGGFDMKVKGTVYTTTKVTVIEAFGEERWKSFMAKLAEKDKYFKDNIIMSITLIPLDKIIFFLDELINECFNNDKNSYLMFGMVGAKFALSSEGPYQSYLLTKDIKSCSSNRPYLNSGRPIMMGVQLPRGLRTTLFMSKSQDFPSNIFTTSNFLWVTLSRPSKFSGRKLLRNRSGVLHRAMMIFISSLN
jgi:hypothetical protein